MPSNTPDDPVKQTIMFKRAFDLAASIVGLSLAALPILLLTLVIRASSPGPGLFSQSRVGRHKRLFTCYKLRTMYLGTTSAGTHEISHAQVTSIGRWLRRLKLDELPQLWNVLRGDMSLVGPRPCLPTQVELVAARDARGVFAVRPGVTGLSQVMGIDMSAPTHLAELDARGISEQSFLGDMYLIWRTLTGSGLGDRTKV